MSLLAEVRLRTALFTWFGCLVLGAVVVALPDSNQRLFSFSEAHGPSLLDALGALVMLGGWIVFLAGLWRRRATIAQRAGVKLLVLVAFALGLGVGLLVASVSGHGWWWIGGSTVLLATQLYAAYLGRG